MTRHLLAGLALTLMGLGGLAATEPRYNGQPLSFWLQGLTDADVRIRTAAAYALAEIGAPAKAAVPALQVALRDQDSRVRAATIQALEKIGTPGVPGLCEAMRDSDAGLQVKAIEALGNLSPAAKQAVAKLEEQLDHEAPSFDPDRFILVANTLARMGPEVKAAIPRLRRVLLLDDQELLGRVPDRIGLADQLRRTAATTLAKIHEPEGSGRIIALMADSPAANWRVPPASEARTTEAYRSLLATVERILNQKNQEEQAVIATLRSLSKSLPRAPRDPELAKAVDRIEKIIDIRRTPLKPAQPETKPAQVEKKPLEPENKPAASDVKPPPAEVRPPLASEGISSAADEALAAIDAYRSPFLAVIWELCGPAESQTQAIHRLAAHDGKRTRADAQNILWQALSEVTDIPTVERIAKATGAIKSN